MNENQKIVYLDCDGTVMTFRWPQIGEPNPRWKPVIRRLIKAGYKVIINTARVHDNHYGSFQKVKPWFKEQYPEYDFEYTDRKIDPQPWNLTSDNDVLYIDDIAPDIPLMHDDAGRDLVHWGGVSRDLKKANII